jgi:tol-pal system protein YbgF
MFADSYPDDARAGTALYWTGDIAYSVMRNYEDSARTFAELLKRYPMTARAPESMLKLGLSLFELGQMKAGCDTLAALPAKYPDANAALTMRARNERRDRSCR